MTAFNVHRTGRIPILRRLATETERWPFSAGQPGWVELPSTLALFSLITALLGMYWDISLHIADSRDTGPLANPAHDRRGRAVPGRPGGARAGRAAGRRLRRWACSSGAA